MNTTDNRPKAIAVDMGGTTSGSGAGGGGGASGILQYGSSGTDVRNLQTTLSGLGYNVGTVDGIFGNQTKNAVMQYQKDMGLSADGIVGSQTWGALNGSNKPNIPNYNDVLNGMAAQNPQVSQNTVSQMTVPEVMPNAPAAPKTQSGTPNYNDVLNDLAAKNPQVSPNVVDMLRVPDMNQTGNSGTPVTDAAPTGGNNSIGNNPGGNVPTGGNTPAPTVQTPTSQDILAMYDEQQSATETPVPNTPEPAAPAPAPSAYTPPERNPYYEPNYRRLLEEMEAYPEFSYDPNSDPLWASLAKQYRREGQRATAEALGQAAGLTGGIASTAAVTAASQAGDYYGAQLSDRLQDVYNNAYQQYLDRYSRLLGLTQEYRWGTDFEENQFTGDRSFDRGVYTDDRNFDYDQYLSDRDFKYKQETDSYNRQQSSMQDAQSRVASYISMGGDPAQLDPALVQQSGFSANELQQMRTYYAQQAAAAAAKASGGGSSSGGGGIGTRGGGGANAGSDASDAESGGYQNTYDKMFNAGIRDAGQARDWLKQNGFTPTEQKSMAEYFESVYMPGKNGDNAGIDPTPSASDTPAANVGNSVAGKRVRTVGDDQISFSYDQDEGTYRFGGKIYMTLDDVIDAINRTNMTDNQLDAVIKSMRAYLGDKIVDGLLSD